MHLRTPPPPYCCPYPSPYRTHDAAHGHGHVTPGAPPQVKALGTLAMIASGLTFEEDVLGTTRRRGSRAGGGGALTASVPGTPAQCARHTRRSAGGELSDRSQPVAGLVALRLHLPLEPFELPPPPRGASGRYGSTGRGASG